MPERMSSRCRTVAPAKPLARQLRDVRRQGRRRVEQTAVDERSGDRADERLADRHQQVPHTRRHPLRVLLGDDLTGPRDDPAVGVGLGHHVGDGGHRAVVQGDRDGADVDRGGGEVRHGTCPPGDRGGREQLVDVLEGPAQLRGGLPVVQRDADLGLVRPSSQHCVPRSLAAGPSPGRPAAESSHGRVDRRGCPSVPAAPRAARSACRCSAHAPSRSGAEPGS